MNNVTRQLIRAMDDDIEAQLTITSYLCDAYASFGGTRKDLEASFFQTAFRPYILNRYLSVGDTTSVARDIIFRSQVLIEWAILTDHVIEYRARHIGYALQYRPIAKM